ncbi:hypothetical protein SAMN05660748_0301 [Blastococcus aggregatus]|uniref:Secreted protein n=1 Tax=Blastococcus aggregatus TaxID=38502 RepID=A0A285UXY3_9ACTN|nr:hypothetical protein [Blastococcus aggregatus]SOC46537.1 hypothetical protein SAMN05660748_0301 [Blastococcus aggregatus]
MNAIRRTAVLLGLVAAVVVGTVIPASAAFSANTPAVAAKVITGSVTAPASVNVAKSCTQTQTGGGYYNSYGQWVAPTYSYWYQATVTWPAGSATSGVTGYRVMAHLNNGQSVVMAETNAATRTVSQTVDRGYLNYQPRLSVITLTRTGWTAETARTAVLSC